MRRTGRILSFVVLVIAVVSLVGVTVGGEKGAVAEAEKLKATVRRSIEEIWNKGNLDFIGELHTADLGYQAPPSVDIRGTDAYRQYVAGFHTTYPDLQLTIDELIVEGTTGAMRWTLRGTHAGPEGGSARGKKVVITGCVVFRAVDDKIADMWNYADNLSMYQQLGYTLVPPEGQGGE